MAKLDYKTLASGLKLSSEKKPDESDEPKVEKDAEESLGKKALAAIKSGNAEAFEEAIRAIAGG